VDARVWNKEGYFEYPDADGITADEVPDSGKMLLQLLQSNSAKPSGRKGTSNPIQAQALFIRDDSPPPASKPVNIKRASAKSTPQKSSGGGSKETSPAKWAWSAFQNSPDPKTLPMPTFASLERRRSHRVAVTEPPLQEDASVEQSMTQDLRRMLNLA
jgi:hypothetical protein